jgi:hypothetical protein
MSDHDATVRNAADPTQVQYGARKEKRASETRVELLRTQLSTPAGRRFVWDEIERHQVFHRVRVWSREAVYEFLGRRESGLDLWWEVSQGFPEALVLMQQEAQARASRETRERQAVHTPRASEAG